MVKTDFPTRLAGGTLEKTKYDLGKKQRREMFGARTTIVYTLKPK